MPSLPLGSFGIMAGKIKITMVATTPKTAPVTKSKGTPIIELATYVNI